MPNDEGRGNIKGENPTTISFSECGVTVAASSLKQHMEQLHGDSVPRTMGVDVGGGGGTNRPYGVLPTCVQDG